MVPLRPRISSLLSGPIGLKMWFISLADVASTTVNTVAVLVIFCVMVLDPFRTDCSRAGVGTNSLAFGWFVPNTELQA